jgi:hypothetical protein
MGSGSICILGGTNIDLDIGGKEVKAFSGDGLRL